MPPDPDVVVAAPKPSTKKWRDPDAAPFHKRAIRESLERVKARLMEAIRRG